MTFDYDRLQAVRLAPALPDVIQQFRHFIRSPAVPSLIGGYEKHALDTFGGQAANGIDAEPDGFVFQFVAHRFTSR